MEGALRWKFDSGEPAKSHPKSLAGVPESASKRLTNPILVFRDVYRKPMVVIAYDLK